MQPKGDKIKNAIKWISEMKEQHPDKSMMMITDEANIKFDLNPMESEFIIKFFKEEEQKS